MIQMTDAVWGGRKVWISQAKLKLLVLEFRKMWEGIWLSFLRDQKGREKR
jgi:hypothetical protein